MLIQNLIEKTTPEQVLFWPVILKTTTAYVEVCIQQMYKIAARPAGWPAACPEVVAGQASARLAGCCKACMQAACNIYTLYTNFKQFYNNL